MKLAIVAIRAYQRSLGRLLPPRCRFHPSCSEYAVAAISANGFLRGVIQTSWRLARCGPWTAGGIDHPPNRHARPAVDPAEAPLDPMEAVRG